MKVSNFNKMGDVVYSLPVLRALHRLHGEKVHLLVSGSCWQLAPLLWEQPYIAEVELEETKCHEMEDIPRGRILKYWNWYKPGEGLNLSLQPSYFRDDAPIPWTTCYQQAACVDELLPADFIAFPSLVNHRRWHYDITVENEGIPQVLEKTFVVAPEVESLQSADLGIWVKVIAELTEHGKVILVGRSRAMDFETPIMVWRGLTAVQRMIDIRGCTTVATLARLIAESTGFIGAHSFPWHLARHSEVPAVCLQDWREGLRRCLPIDTPYTWIEQKDWQMATDFLTKETVIA